MKISFKLSPRALPVELQEGALTRATEAVIAVLKKYDMMFYAIRRSVKDPENNCWESEVEFATTTDKDLSASTFIEEIQIASCDCAFNFSLKTGYDNDTGRTPEPKRVDI